MTRIICQALHAVVFLLWVGCLSSWFRRGCPVPKWVHVLAGVMLIVGLLGIPALGVWDVLSWRIAGFCVVIPPTAVYVGWLWMFAGLPVAEK
ncbi:MAG: hypothetical protein HN849_27800 [Victivallales bacterium]|jgi:hypothetical protein|nr:hypothetical protein [Victivallales bacterium]MBT7164781.1 hypothetical protein [Victivallales bacterium]MBT7303365.1 hypothetical protein [Victivallales bacterium]